MKHAKLLVASALLIAITAAGVWAQTAEPSAPPRAAKPRSSIMVDEERVAALLAAEEPKIKERIGRIDAEVAALDRSQLKDDDWAKEWAGQYYEGDGLGENVRIHLAPKAGIAYLNYGCMGLYGGDHGDIIEPLPDGLRLKLVIGQSGGSFLTERVYFVRWGERRYLVPDWAMMQVVNNYNEGGFGRINMFQIPRLERDGKRNGMYEEAAPPGKPVLPAEFAKLLRDDPISLKVTKVSPIAEARVTSGVDAYKCTFEFEGGSDRGVYLGQEFWLTLSGASGKVQISRVDAGSCTGEFVAYGSPNTPIKQPTVGEVVNTGERPSAAPEDKPDEAPRGPVDNKQPTPKIP